MRLPCLLFLLILAACAPTDVPVPPAATTAVTVPAEEGGALRALLALPPGGAPGVAVVALHSCAGMGAPDGPMRLNAREADWMARLVQAGHPVLMPDSFGSRGLGPACGRRGYPADPLRRRGDALAAAAWAAAQPWAAPGGVVLLGWSHGGSTVLQAVAAPVPAGLLRAAIAFYPGCEEIRRGPAWQPVPPVLLLLGGADNWTPPTPCRALAAAYPERLDAVTYPGASHGFDTPAQRPLTLTLETGRMVTVGTDPAARDAARLRVADFLAAHGGAAP